MERILKDRICRRIVRRLLQICGLYIRYAKVTLTLIYIRICTCAVAGVVLHTHAKRYGVGLGRWYSQVGLVRRQRYDSFRNIASYDLQRLCRIREEKSGGESRQELHGLFQAEL